MFLTILQILWKKSDLAWTKPIDIHAFMISRCLMRVKDKWRGWRSLADFRATFVSSKYNAVERPLTVTFLQRQAFPVPNMTVVETFDLCLFYWKILRHVVNLVLRHVLAIAVTPTLFLSTRTYTLPYSWIHHKSGIVFKDYEISLTRFRFVQFSIRAFFPRSVSSKFIKLCMGTPCWC